MANKHPYISGTGALSKAIPQFRNSLPNTIDSSTLKKLGIAPKNESYLINILKFIDVIGEDGTPTPEAKNTFSQHDDEGFAEKFKTLVSNAYDDMFSLHGEKTWSLDETALITYFRQTDQTTALVGSRQAKTFQILAAFSGHGEIPEVKAAPDRKPRKAKEKPAKQEPKKEIILPKISSPSKEQTQRDFGLTVRVEINLPSGGDQETYDRIFKSIKANLLNG